MPGLRMGCGFRLTHNKDAVAAISSSRHLIAGAISYAERFNRPDDACWKIVFEDRVITRSYQSHEGEL